MDSLNEQHCPDGQISLHANKEQLVADTHPAPVTPGQTQVEQDSAFMRLALQEARAAGKADEVPIGAIVVKDGKVIATAANARETAHDPAGHAELLAIRAASQALGAWRLTGCTVYVTLEPCIMCAGLMHQARIDRCVYGAPDPKAGALGTLYSIHEDERLNHTFMVTSGVCADESAQLLKDFFRKKRKGANAANTDFQN